MKSFLAVLQKCEGQFHHVQIQEREESMDILLIQGTNKCHWRPPQPRLSGHLTARLPFHWYVCGSLPRTRTWEPGLESGGRWDRSLISDSGCCPRQVARLLPRKVEIMGVTQCQALRWADWQGSQVPSPSRHMVRRPPIQLGAAESWKLRLNYTLPDTQKAPSSPGSGLKILNKILHVDMVRG